VQANVCIPVTDGETSMEKRFRLRPLAGFLACMAVAPAKTVAQTVLALQRPLHEGDALGAIDRAFVFTVGWLPPLLVVTGAMMWLRGRRVRKAPTA
jgi:uncharacterized iron-regulated membrane protein